MSLDKLQQTFINVLDKHAPMKHKNQAPFMNKFLQKAVMNRSRLKNKYLRSNATHVSICSEREKKNFINK